ncbi:MAG: ABC transporter ATP-binding protein [Geminicoccaceae bacterium]|nr:ABC transporter ATP-binding protein [Geminicoccaceae bacterium]
MEPSGGDAREGGASPLLRLEGVTKRFGALLANDAVDLDLAQGEILGLLGENGAGKTTLMNILFGHYAADSGRILVADRRGRLRPLPGGSPGRALAAGVGMVHQHFALAANLSVIESVTLGTEPLFRPWQGRRDARRRLRTLVDETGLDVPLDAAIGALSVGERQRVEILKALYRGARVLVLDEPTAVLTPQQAERLADTLRGLASRGLGVVFISHKLDEVLALCDRVVVLRHGQKVREAAADRVTKAELAEAMVDRPVQAPTRLRGQPGAVVVEMSAVRVGAAPGREPLDDVRLSVLEGEIFGVAGIAGNGQRSLAAVLSGTLVPDSGQIRLRGVAWPKGGPLNLTRAGVGRVPEDRHAEGVVGAMTVWENAAIETVRLRASQRLGLLRRRHLIDDAERLVRLHDVRCRGVDVPASELSGGNMQKLILARVLDREPRFLLAAQPTRGLDIGAVAEIHRRLLEARARGAGILLLTEDLDELLQLADRIAVIHRGRLSRPLAREAATLRRLGLMMTGQVADAA